MSTCSAGERRSFPLTCVAHAAASAGSPVPAALVWNAPESNARTSASAGLRGASTRHLLPNRPRLLGLGDEHVPRGDVVVPLDQRRDVAAELARAAIERPHRIDDVIAVRIEDVFAVI